MKGIVRLPADIERSVVGREPCLWLNDCWRPLQNVDSGFGLNLDAVRSAEQRLNEYSGLLARLFPELEASAGVIESPLCDAANLQRALMRTPGSAGRWFVKGDHTLPVAGSIKARGGIYEVLLHAEGLARRDGILGSLDDCEVLASPKARDLFARHAIAVGSTGNLGLSIGVMAAALGFRAIVHMSFNAKKWKKNRLRARGAGGIALHVGALGLFQ